MTHRIFATLAFTTLVLGTSAAHARLFWNHPNTEPFIGTHKLARKLFIENGFPAPILREQFQMLHNGKCYVRRIQQGEELAAMLFGRGSIISHVVAETALWNPSISRRATFCNIRTHDWKYSLVIPHVCNNISEEIRSRHGRFPPPFFGSPLGPPPIFFQGWRETGGAWLGMAFASVGTNGSVVSFGPGGINFTQLPNKHQLSFISLPSRIPNLRYRFFHSAIFRYHHHYHHHYSRLKHTKNIVPLIAVPATLPTPTLIPTPIPEPGSLGLFAIASVILVVIRGRKG